LNRSRGGRQKGQAKQRIVTRGEDQRDRHKPHRHRRKIDDVCEVIAIVPADQAGKGAADEHKKQLCAEQDAGR
jgi:hypothetical protein